MYKFLGKLLSAAVLVLLASACGPGRGKMSEKDKQDLLSKGDKPLKDIQGDDKKKVETILMDVLANDFDYESYEVVMGLLKSRSDLSPNEATCKEELKKKVGEISKGMELKENRSKNVKAKEQDIKAHFADINVNQFIRCAEKLPTVREAFVGKFCSVKTNEEVVNVAKEAVGKLADTEEGVTKCQSLIGGYMSLLKGEKGGGEKGGGVPMKGEGAEPKGEGKPAAAGGEKK